MKLRKISKLSTLACLALGALSGAPAASQPDKPPFVDRLNGDISPAHDPSIIKAGDRYYLFTTTSAPRDGPGLIGIRTSQDLERWTNSAPALPAMPDWALKAVPDAKGIWAPDISFVNGRYRLYYSISTFGSNRSAIGLATSASLDPSAPDYGWKDEGEVFSSSRWDNYNAIDPNFFIDREGRHWLAFGSFWSGIKLVRLDPNSGKRSVEDKTIHALAERPRPGAIEAPFLIERSGYYYLFASNDFCCRGADSTYYTIVGRSKEVAGPYLDADGKPLLKGHGQVVLHGKLDKSGRWRGPGHVSVIKDGARHYILYHAYDAQHRGQPTLRISELGWTADGWPVAKY